MSSYYSSSSCTLLRYILILVVVGQNVYATITFGGVPLDQIIQHEEEIHNATTANRNLQLFKKYHDFSQQLDGKEALRIVILHGIKQRLVQGKRMGLNMTFNGKPLPSDFGPASNYYNRGQVPDPNENNNRGLWNDWSNWLNTNVVDPVVENVVEPVVNGLDDVVDGTVNTVEDVLDDAWVAVENSLDILLDNFPWQSMYTKVIVHTYVRSQTTDLVGIFEHFTNQLTVYLI